MQLPSLDLKSCRRKALRLRLAIAGKAQSTPEKHVKNRIHPGAKNDLPTICLTSDWLLDVAIVAELFARARLW